jgi:hypothetical protein
MANPNFNNLFVNEDDTPIVEHTIQDTINLVNKVLAEHMDRPFIIIPDGTSQTQFTNTGRVGFWVERQFGITPNNSQNPDAHWGEIKTVNCDKFKTCSIGTISRLNWSAIEAGLQDTWLTSFAHKKMAITLFVFYSKKIIDNADWVNMPQYTLKRMGIFEFDKLAHHLEDDWARIVHMIKRSSGYGNARYTGTYLKLTYKGDAQHVYPSISFSAKFMRDVFTSLSK